MRGCSGTTGGGDLDGWACNVIDKTKRLNPPPSPPPPPPQPLYHATYGTTCADFARRTLTVHGGACSDLLDPVSCNARFRESNTLVPSTHFAHVVEPCTWILVGRSAGHCAQGDPIECTPAMISGR